MKKEKVGPLSSRRALALIVGLLLFTATWMQSRWNTVVAQSPGTNWGAPVNLSNSGSSSEPALIVDAEQRAHALWIDEFTGYRYSQSVDGEEWSPPVSVAFPFGVNHPKFLVGPNNFIYAVWIDERNALHASRVPSDQFSNRTAWIDQGTLSENTQAFHVYIDAEETLHLVYITSTGTVDQPSGVFYRASAASGTAWGSAVPIYSSLYYRGITAEEAHIRVTSIEEDNGKMILAAWDDPFLGKILISRSNDLGLSWDAPEEISAGTPASGSTTLSFVDLAAWNDQVLVTWRSSSSSDICSVLFQVLTIGGSGWSTPQNFLSNQTSCPSDSGFLVNQTDLLIWQETVNNQVYFVAWDGKQWSPPQIQPDLAGFIDPITSRPLTIDARQSVAFPETNTIGAVLSDSTGNNDIWFLSRNVGQVKDWFFTTDSWSNAEELATVNSPETVRDLSVISDSGGNFHSLWVQSAQQTSAGTGGTSTSSGIYYSKWSGDSSAAWLEPVQIHQGSLRSFRQLSAAASGRDEIHLVWLGENSGELFFSKAPAARAFSRIEWSRQVQVPTTGVTLSSPVIAAGQQGNVWIVYAVPFNENRGIYVVRSSDDGETWDAPVRIFDGQSAGWEMVGLPVVALSEDGRLHVLWQKETPFQDFPGSGLGYSYSDDGGSTWSEPDLDIVRDNITWAGLVPMADGQLFRAWQAVEDGQVVIYAQTSANNGAAWGDVVSVISSGKHTGNPQLVANAAGIHLLQINSDQQAKIILRHWTWSNSNWLPGDNLEIQQEAIRTITGLAASISPLERLAVLFSTENIVANRQSVQAVLNYLGSTPTVVVETQQSTEPVVEVTPTVTSQPIPTVEAAVTEASPTPELPPTATPEPSPTIDLSGNGAYADPNSPNAWVGLILGSLLAGAIVVAVFGLRMLRGSSGAGKKKIP